MEGRDCLSHDILMQIDIVFNPTWRFFLYHYFIQRMSQVPNIKYKTQLCLYWLEGKYCEKANHCFFAHGPQELRTIEQNHQEIMLRNIQSTLGESKPYNYKTIFCKFYAEGMCKLGEKCTYAHQRREKRKKKGSQEYPISNNLVPNAWDPMQYNEYVNNYYYYQMQEVYPYIPEASIQACQEMTSQLSHIKINSNNSSEEVQSINLSSSALAKPALTFNQIDKEPSKSEGDRPSPSHLDKNQDSPSSGQTKATVHERSAQLEVSINSCQFK